MNTESLVIHQMSDNSMTVRMTGDHETVDENEPASNAYLMATALWALISDGTVFAKVEEMWGMHFTGSVVMESTDENTDSVAGS